ncbi:helix-turn-helix transcriptional regulator [Faecalibacter sp. LW9]|uniref:helix-turn-helix transcriptional regulator n=1 Tax=Faecalibacter sp. LW9 TaxID=3103144 RepID=UPI002AFE8AC5|nr:helix-turn-helix transcriptional regulator [Faecalibacter sp. LW9]
MDSNYFSIYINIGEKLKLKRKSKGLTQQQLADKITKLDRSKISDIENGKEDFLLSTLLKICSALEIEPKDLFE